MLMDPLRDSLTIVVGSGGVGKTTLSAALGMRAARAGADTLVMTFDPSLRLKDTLGVGDAALDREVPVAYHASGQLNVSLLDARRTFDRLIARYAPDERAAERILRNRFYDHLSGSLAGVLEYMAVERLFEIASERRYDCVILDTPPARQALDFLEAPARIVGFLDSGAISLALKPWFDKDGRLRATSHLGILGRGVERFFDHVIGLGLLRDMAEFFQAFAPLFAGFRERAERVGELLRDDRTCFALVTTPDSERVPETLFFARRLVAAGHHLGPVILNMVHPKPPSEADIGRADPALRDGLELFRHIAERDQRGIEAFRRLLPRPDAVIELPSLDTEPTDMTSLDTLSRAAEIRLGALDAASRQPLGGLPSRKSR
ncbi:MAG: ArsA family ATPase [Acidobacteriota bacterium]